MPELPEVEALTSFVADRAVGRAVRRVDVAAINVLKTYDPPPSALVGQVVAAVRRHGKFIDLDLGAHHLVFHLARGGWLRWNENLPAAPPKPGRSPIALRLHLAAEPVVGPSVGGAPGFDLTEAGTRKRLSVYCVRSPQDVPGIARLGPDPLDPAFTAQALAQIVGGARQRIKGVLRDQSVIAGIGNAYSDEVLHVARLSPYKIAATLSAAEIGGLHEAITTTLTEAVRRSAGLGAGELKAEKKLGMRVHGRAGQPCPVCGDTVREVSFADSSLQYCPSCQTGGQVLADRRMSRLLK